MPTPARSVPAEAAFGAGGAGGSGAAFIGCAGGASVWNFEAAFPSHTALGCGLPYRFGNSFDQLNARVTLNGTDDTFASELLHRCLGRLAEIATTR